MDKREAPEEMPMSGLRRWPSKQRIFPQQRLPMCEMHKARADAGALRETCHECDIKGMDEEIQRIAEHLERQADSRVQAALAPLLDSLTAALEEKPLANGEYVHLPYCNGDWKQPPGTQGVSCCCLPRKRAAESALRDMERQRDEARAELEKVGKVAAKFGPCGNCGRAHPEYKGYCPSRDDDAG